MKKEKKKKLTACGRDCPLYMYVRDRAKDERIQVHTSIVLWAEESLDACGALTHVRARARKCGKKGKSKNTKPFFLCTLQHKLCFAQHLRGSSR